MSVKRYWTSRSMLCSESIGIGCEVVFAADHDAEVARLKADLGDLERKIRCMVLWLEANQADVFSRGLWDALAPVDRLKDALSAADAAARMWEQNANLMATRVEQAESKLATHQLRWTEEKPKEEGVYWHREGPQDTRPSIVELFGNSWYLAYGPVSINGGQFAGPIPQPEG